jgi:hypothetical protein
MAPGGSVAFDYKDRALGAYSKKDKQPLGTVMHRGEPQIIVSPLCILMCLLSFNIQKNKKEGKHKEKKRMKKERLAHRIQLVTLFSYP